MKLNVTFKASCCLSLLLFQDVISPELVDLFNRIFVLEPSFRISLRDIAIHPWVNTTQEVSPADVKAEMMARYVCAHVSVCVHMSVWRACTVCAFSYW